MKPRKLILVALVVAIIGIGIWWWFTRSTTAVPEKTADAPMAAKTDASKQVVSTPITPPSTPPALNPDTVPVATPPTTTVAAAPPTDSNAADIEELKFINADIAFLVQSGDLARLYQTYTRPDKLNPLALQTLQANQEAMQRIPADQRSPIGLQIQEESAKSYEDLEDQIPTFNAAGDEATYNITIYGPAGMIPDRQSTVTFIKIDGKWYRK
jgi:cytoskeletal protein RodZ